MYGESLLLAHAPDQEVELLDLQERNIICDFPALIEEGCKIVCLREPHSEVTTLICACKGHVATSSMHAKIRAYIVSNILDSYTLVGCNNEPGWIREAKAMNAQSYQVYHTVHPQCIGNMSAFRVTRAFGRYGSLYADRHYVVITDVSYRNPRHTDPNVYAPTSQGPIIGIGYHGQSPPLFSVSSTVCINSTFESTICSAELMSLELSYVVAAASCNSGQWRECVHREVPSLVLISSPRGGRIDYASLIDIHMKLLVNLVDLCMKDMKIQIILIYGEPNKIYSRLISRYKCCFVYESDWEREADLDVWNPGSLRMRSISNAMIKAQIGSPARVERDSKPVQIDNVMVLGIDQLDYSGLSTDGTYILCLNHVTAASGLPCMSLLGLVRRPKVFSLAARFHALLNDCVLLADESSATEFNYNLYIPRHLYAYVNLAYRGI